MRELLLKIFIVGIFCTVASANFNKNIEFGKTRAVLASPDSYQVIGKEYRSDNEECTYNVITVIVDVNGTEDDDGLGNDIITCRIYDDGKIKAEQNLSVKVGEEKQLTYLLQFEGVYGTSAPGVGVYCYELGIEVDPFVPEVVDGTCPSVTVPVSTPFQLLMLIGIFIIGLSRIKKN